MIKGLLFDLDGTLINVEKYIAVFTFLCHESLKECDPNTKIEGTEAEMYKPLQLPFEESNRYLKEVWGVDPAEYWENVQELDFEGRKRAIQTGIIEAYEDAAVLRELKDYKLAIISNTPLPITLMELASFGLFEYFDYWNCSNYKDENSKPDVKGAKLLLEKMGLKVEEAMLVGDSDIDKQLGANLKMKTRRVIRGNYDYFNKDIPAGFDYGEIRSLKEIRMHT